jgi:large subunit ribosomal protein L7/L12
MYVSMPVLAAIAIAFLVLLALAVRRRSGERDLIAPPRAEAWPRSRGAAAGNASLTPELEAEVRALNSAGRKIEAIKRLRAATGLGLAEAKALVERM